MAIFEFSNGHFGEIATYIGNFFFVIFGQNDVFYILAEFEVDGMRPNECTKMDEGALKGKTEIFLSISSAFLITSTKINLENKISCLSDNLRIFVIQPVFG